MTIFCLERFKRELEKIRRNKHHQGIELKIIDYFFDKSISDLVGGNTKLNNSQPTPYVKKRIQGGEYRFYFLLVIKKKYLFLTYVHSETNQHGLMNIDDDFKTTLYKEILESIKSKDLLEVTTDEAKSKLVYSKVHMDSDI